MSDNGSQKQKHVYVVDDDWAVLDSMRTLLETEGYDVSVCDNAKDFLEHALQDGDGVAKGCLLLDLHMGGMSGIELIEKLRAHQIDIPIIVITGAGTAAQKARASELGAHAVFDKPVDNDVLFQSLEATLV